MPAGPRWAPCWPHEPCYLGLYIMDEIADIAIRVMSSESHDVWNHQHPDCRFRPRTTKTSQLHIIRPLWGESSPIAENISMSLFHHICTYSTYPSLLQLDPYSHNSRVTMLSINRLCRRSIWWRIGTGCPGSDVMNDGTTCITLNWWGHKPLLNFLVAGTV